MASYLSEWELSVSWNQDYHGLWDTKRQVSTKNRIPNLSVLKPGQLIKDKENVISFEPQEIKANKIDPFDNPFVLATISDSSEGVMITPLNTGEGRFNKFWEVLKANDKKIGHRMKLHDTFRVGNVNVKISQIKRKDDYENLDKVDLFESISKAKNNEIQERPLSAVCRVCLLEQEEDDNPLISPCGCVNDEKYIHLECLRKWMMSKMDRKYVKNITIIRRKVLSCELCKRDFPTNVKHNDKEISLIESSDDRRDSFVVLECSMKEQKLGPIFIIDLSTDYKYTIGRERICDIRFRETSVSRTHAFFIVSKGDFYLSDNNSKRGTRMLQKDPIILNSNVTVSPWLQCEKILFKFSLNKLLFRRRITKQDSSVGCPLEEKSEKEELEILEKENIAIQNSPTER